MRATRLAVLPSETVKATGTGFGVALGQDSQDSMVQQAAAAAAATTTNVTAEPGQLTQGAEGLLKQQGLSRHPQPDAAAVRL